MMKFLLLFMCTTLCPFLLQAQITNGQINYELYVDQWRQNCDNDNISADDNEVRVGLTSDANTGGTATWTSGGNGATCGGNNYVRRWQTDAPSTVTNTNTRLYRCVGRNEVTNTFNINHSSWEEDGTPDCSPTGDACQSSGTWGITFKSAAKTPSNFWANNGTLGTASFVTGQSGDFSAKTVWRYTNGTACGNALDFGTLTSGTTYFHTNSNRPTPAGASADLGYVNTIGNTANDVFYQFVLATPATVTISTNNAGSNYDNYLRLYNSTACGTQIAFNDDAVGTLAVITADLCAGTYVILVEGFSANVGDFNLSVLANNQAITGGTIAGGTSPICTGSDPGAFTSTTNGTGTGTLTYQWEQSTTNAGAGYSDIGGATGIAYDMPVLTQTTWYRRRVTDGCGRVAYSNVIQITVNALSTLGTISNAGPVNFCDAGGNFTTAVNVSGQTGSIMWDWGSNNGVWNNNWVAGANSGICCFPKKTSNSDGNADRIRYRVTNGACPAVTSATVLIQNRYNEAPTSLASSNTVYCSNAAPANITLTATFPTNINMNGTVRFYSGSCGGTLVGSVSPVATSATAALTIATPAATTTYYARYEPGAGTGCANTACVQTTVTVQTLSVAPTSIIGTTTICAGGNTTLTLIGGTAGTGATAEWFSGSCGGTLVGTGNSVNVSPVANTTYFVRYTGTCNTTTCASVTVTVQTLSVAPTSITGITTICAGASTTLTLSGGTAGTGATVQWFSGSCGGTLVGTGNSVNVSPAANTTYFVRYVGTCNITTCASVVVTVQTLSVAPTSITGTTTICAGGNTTLTLSGGTAGTGATAQWYSGACGGTLVGTGNSVNVAPAANTTYFVRYSGTCNTTTCASVGVTVQTLSVAPTSITGITTICAGGNTTLTLSGGTAGTGATAQWYSGACGGTLVGTGNSVNVSPVANTTYFVRYSGTCNTTTCASVAVTVDLASTSPTIAALGEYCPNSNIVLSASGGVEGTGSVIYWYDAPNGGGTLLGTGNSINVSPMLTTTYYARREGTCNTTADDSEVATIKTFNYAANNTVATTYCTDISGWHHFYNGSEIILSLQGDLSGVATIDATIWDNGSFYSNGGNPALCDAALTPGEQQFEMERSWNINYTGTLNGSYNVRYYYPMSERNAVETAAANWMATYPNCAYTYKYNPGANGWFWFKNTGSAYTAPQYDGLVLAGGGTSSVNGINYSIITGVTSFSGGTGGVTLVPDADLPIDLISFDAKRLSLETVQLDWATASELNNAGFEIERMLDHETEFKKIGFVNGMGNSHSTVYYSYEDVNAYMGISYYRLRQVDFDGTASYSNTRAVEGDKKAGSGGLLVYPNPTKDVLNIYLGDVPKDISQATISILDILGKVVYSTTIDITPYQVVEMTELRNMPSASYILKIQYNNGTEAIERFVKE